MAANAESSVIPKVKPLPNGPASRGKLKTNNSLQMAPLMSTPSTSDDVVMSTSQSGGSLEGLPAMDGSGDAGISPALVSLITQTVQAALAAERANNPPSSLASTPPIPSMSNPSVPSTMTSAGSGAFLLCCPAQRTPF